jgi:uncharacterized protein YbjT (DUF2867 family)
VARALIVGCGCRGLELGRALAEQGWLVRGTTRRPERTSEIEGAGIEARVADPGRLDTVLELVDDIAVVYWLMGSAAGEPEALAAMHGSKLELLLRHLVDTPVRGFVYEAPGSAEADVRAHGPAIVRGAAERWRIPVEVVEAPPADPDAWRDAMVAAAERVTSSPESGGVARGTPTKE